MKRKLVRQGISTMMISLPSKWIKANNLDKGDEIDLEEKGNELVIGAEVLTKGKKEIKIDITPENKHDISPLLTHTYRKGFDRIILEGINPSLIKEIRTIADKLLLGFELTEKNSSKCIVENISEPSENKYEVMLRKLFMIINDSLETTLRDFESHKLQNLHEMEETKSQQDKFALFCMRLLTKSPNEKNFALQWELIKSLMHIQHSIHYLYKFAAESKLKPEAHTISLLKELKEYFSFYQQAHYSRDIKAIHKINSLKNTYQFGKCLTAIEKSKGKNAVIYSYIRELFRLIQIGTSPILAEILETDLGKP